MANPQKENGHTDIANEIMEKLARYRISGQEYQILFVVLRQTWGWHKKEDEISLSQFAEKTEMNRPAVARAIKKLVSKKILGSINKDTTFANKYRFNKDYEQWKPSIKKDTGGINKDTTSGINKDNRGVSIMIHTKENYTKETISKEKTMSANADAFESFWSIYPKKEQKKKSQEVWQRKKLDSYLPAILEFIKGASATDRWKKGYIKLPTAFLNGECWNDDLASYMDNQFINKSNSITIRS